MKTLHPLVRLERSALAKPARKRRRGNASVWIEVYAPDGGLVEHVGLEIRQILKDAGASFTGPSSLKEVRPFSLYDYGDRDHGKEEINAKCHVRRIALECLNPDLIAVFKKHLTGRGVRMMIRTKTANGESFKNI